MKSIRHKIIFSIYLILFPVLIFMGGFTYYQKYNDIMDENIRRYRAAVQALAQNIQYFDRDLTDISTYFCVDNGILRVLSVGVDTDDRLFWTTHAPMEFIQSILAIKSQIITLTLYPENGLAPFYVSRDASVPVLDVNAIRELDIYDAAVAAQGDIVWAKANMQDGSLFANNKSDKILLCREIFDLTKKHRLGFLVLSAHVEWYERMCANALLSDNEGIAIFGEGPVPMVTQGELDPSLLEALAQSHSLGAQPASAFQQYGDSYVFASGRQVGEKTIYYVTPVQNWNEQVSGSLSLPLLLAVVALACIWPLSALAARIISRPHYMLLLRERESELTALQAQINPHFLYNTLGSLYWRALGAGQDKLAEDVLSLSELFRLLLSSGQSEIPVERELSIVSHYLNIQKMRFPQKLDYCIDVSDDILNMPILKLVVQPFVENAIVHGLERKDGLGTVSIEGRRANGMICFTIKDNGIGMTDEQLKQVLAPEDDTRYAKQRIGHYAVRNVRERLGLRYGKNFTLNIESAFGEGTTVYIEIPAQSDDQEG